jgi:hypothetical protein
MNEIAPISAGELIDSVITKGDLARLTPAERTQYYVRVCESVGLNALTKPFEYITLNGRLVLYALRGATDQLRTLHGVSVEELSETERDGVFIVTARVKNRDGRGDMAKGAVSIKGLSGDALANALMKAETKAKRRATLSLCGLGMLDETEIETIPVTAAQRRPQAEPLPIYDPETGEVDDVLPYMVPLEQTNGKSDFIRWGGILVKHLKASNTLAEGEEWIAQQELNLAKCEAEMPAVYKRIEAQINVMRVRLADFITPA